MYDLQHHNTVSNIIHRGVYSMCMCNNGRGDVMTTLQDKVKFAIKSAPIIDGDPFAVWLDEVPKIDMETNNREEADIMIDDVCWRIAQACAVTYKAALVEKDAEITRLKDALQIYANTPYLSNHYAIKALEKAP